MDVDLGTFNTLPPIHSLMVIAAMNVGQIAILVIAVIVLTFLMLSTRNRLRRSTESNESSARERYNHLQQKKKAMRDVDDVMLELDRLARHLQGQLDTRFVKLETVIRDADERIETLSRLLTSTQSKPSFDITLESENPYEQVAEPKASNNDSPFDNERYSTIYRLADDGFSAEEIAQKVSQKTGEVELILALRKTKEQAGVVSSKNPSN